MKSVLSNKRGQLGNLQGIILTLVVVGILIGVGFLVLEKFAGQMTTASQAQAGVNDTITAFKQIPTFLPIIIIVAIVGILLAIVFSVLPRSGMAA
jgi:uncharacterized BrkB/YihY/UPF0761 family membrane protein